MSKVPCKYGAKCFRKEKTHLEKFAHDEADKKTAAKPKAKPKPLAAFETTIRREASLDLADYYDLGLTEEEEKETKLTPEKSKVGSKKRKLAPDGTSETKSKEAKTDVTERKRRARGGKDTTGSVAQLSDETSSTKPAKGGAKHKPVGKPKVKPKADSQEWRQMKNKLASLSDALDLHEMKANVARLESAV